MTARTSSSLSTASLSKRIAAGLTLLFIGCTLSFAVGLSNMAVAHNAAHDTRHAIGFPCH